MALRQDLGGAAGANAAALVTTGASHVAVYNWTFLLGQSLMPGINALLLGSLLYRSRLVPRVIPVLGLIGAPLLITAVIATLFGGIGQYSSLAALAALPVAAWKLRLASGWSQGLQARPHQSRNDRSRHRARLPRRHRLSPEHGRAHQRPGRCPRPVRTPAHTKSFTRFALLCPRQLWHADHGDLCLSRSRRQIDESRK